MELGRYAYMLERAKRPLDVVDVLAPADPGEVGTLEEQRQFVFGFYGLSPTRRSTGRTPADAEERPCLTAMYAAGPSRGGMLSQVLEYVDPVSEAELDELEELCAAATPGPWFVRVLDDDAAMNLVAVSTRDGSRSATEPWPQFDNGEIVAATLVQSPRYVDIDDERWDENAVFIAEAREAVPRLVAEVRRLKRQIESVSGPLP
ncbi:hypothetical protein LX16_3627 [Stackebrandtia albiflava]|uniref:Uncharacterized protein n=2 Tax=Stackebrandtia albiflava TaxID=406432 RepID=A0A562V4Q9_9ACTN|nr:hypothetical protein LX16_3627 [Stackebrandtia albiflava]